MPALQFPVIMYSIFTNVAFTYGPLFPTIEAGESLIVELLEGFLLAFAISFGVNLFVIPISSRTVVFSKSLCLAINHNTRRLILSKRSRRGTYN